MCGICGVMAERLSLGDYLRFKDLFTLSQLRGDDGAGILTVPNKPHVEKVKIRKTTWSSGHLVTTAEYDEVIKGDNSIILGHARMPTKGASKVEFVHPHVNGNIALVHNGTMSTVGDKLVGANESDSKLICKTIAEHGVKHFVDTSYGAYCLIWVDLGNQTLNFLRNKDRPLWFVEQRNSSLSEDVTHLWWGSELWMIMQSLSRYPSFNKEAVRGYQLPVDEHWSFPLVAGHFLAKPKKEKIEKKYSSNYSYGHWPYEGWDDDYGGTAHTAVVPFRGSNSENLQSYTRNTGVNSGTAGGTTRPTGGSYSPPFQYTPPEHRNSNITIPVVSVGRIIERSKKDAELETSAKLAAIKKETADAAPFPDYQRYAETNEQRILSHISSGTCVWCEHKPIYIDKKPPVIYPVRWAENRKDYVCSECIKDQDVQRMVGVL